MSSSALDPMCEATSHPRRRSAAGLAYSTVASRSMTATMSDALRTSDRKRASLSRSAASAWRAAVTSTPVPMMKTGSPSLPGIAVLDHSMRRRRPSRVSQWISSWLVGWPRFSARNAPRAPSSSSGTTKRSQKGLPSTSCRVHPVASSLARLKRTMRPSGSSTTTRDAIASRIADIESRSSVSADTVAEWARLVSTSRARSSIVTTSAWVNAAVACDTTFSTPVGPRSYVTGAPTTDRVPDSSAAATSTRGSAWVSSQRSAWPVRAHRPERLAVASRRPRTPARLARAVVSTRSSPSTCSTPAPWAPVIASARSTTTVSAADGLSPGALSSAWARAIAASRSTRPWSAWSRPSVAASRAARRWSSMVLAGIGAAGTGVDVGSVPHAHLGGAERAATGLNRDRAEALGAVSSGRFDVRLGLAPGHEGVDGHDDEEEHRGGDEDERDDGVQEVAVGEPALSDVEVEVAEVRLARNRDDRGDDVSHEGGHDCAESSADHHGHGQIDDVAAQEKCLEVSEHERWSSTHYPLRP